MKTLHELRTTLPGTGRLEWIGVSSGSRQSIRELAEANVEIGTGLESDYHARSGRSHRQVTLIQKELLPVIAGLLGRTEFPPSVFRRNLMVSGINLQALRLLRFSIGGILLEGTGNCDPCSRMEEALGTGGYTAMLGFGGITARVLTGGVIRVGDAVEFVDRPKIEE